MRLICPNCDAQYEVDDDLIPEEGRDVQCASCDATWFQAPHKPARAGDALSVVAGAAESDEDERARIRSAVADELQAQQREMARAAAEAEARAAEAEQARTDDNVALPHERKEGPTADAGLPQHSMTAPPATMGGPARRAAAPEPEPERVEDDDFLKTLRAELADTAPPDDGKAPRSARRSVIAAAANAGLDPDELKEEIATGRPKIDPKDLSASLRDDYSDVNELFAEPRSRTPKGIFAGLVLAALAAGVYIKADLVAEKLPQAIPYLEKYVAAVDTGRVEVEKGYGWASTTVMELIDQQLAGSSDGSEAPPASGAGN